MPKAVHFFHFCTIVSKKFTSVVVIFIYAFESSHCVFVEKVIFLLKLTVLEILGFEVEGSN